ncbi:MAG TPA: DUF5360 family protein [Candidatus Limnocylindrales bacterium]
MSLHLATPPGVPRWLPAAMLAVDFAFLAYWTITAAHVIPGSLLFANYNDVTMQTWNWSFLPLDVAASLTGIAAVVFLGARPAAAMRLLPVSLTLTATAGGMAISFWTLQGWVDATWWLPNLALLAFGVAGLLSLARPGNETEPIP